MANEHILFNIDSPPGYLITLFLSNKYGFFIISYLA